MNLSAEQLTSIARSYWPSSEGPHPGMENSPELERLRSRWRQELEKPDRWRAFLRELGGELPEFTLGNATTPRDACLRCAAYPRGDRGPSPYEWVVVGCVSLLAPVYTVYGVQYEYSGTERVRDTVFFDSLPSEIQAAADVLRRRIEAAYGFEALPRELAQMPVPLFVEPRKPPDTTLFHALFTSLPERVP